MASKQPKRRGVSNPRLSISIADKMTAHGLGRDDLIGALQDAVNDDIVADATKGK